MSTINIAISGATGRMGRALVQAVVADPALRLVAALASASSVHLGIDAGRVAGLPEVGVAVRADSDEGDSDSNPGDALSGCDALIEFATVSAALAHLKYCRAHRLAMVIGTTGFDEAAKTAIHDAAEHIPIVLAPNMSIGINLALKLTETAAAVLGDDADVEILEAHHRHKTDAPSGTALRLGEVVAEARGQDLARAGVFTRHGQTGPRRPGTIGFSTIRAADIVGEHTVLFATAGERLEITHRATSRLNYALGAVRAAKFLLSDDIQPGLYDMQDVLGLPSLYDMQDVLGL